MKLFVALNHFSKLPVGLELEWAIDARALVIYDGNLITIPRASITIVKHFEALLNQLDSLSFGKLGSIFSIDCLTQHRSRQMGTKAGRNDWARESSSELVNITKESFVCGVERDF